MSAVLQQYKRVIERFKWIENIFFLKNCSSPNSKIIKNIQVTQTHLSTFSDVTDSSSWLLMILDSFCYLSINLKEIMNPFLFQYSFISFLSSTISNYSFSWIAKQKLTQSMLARVIIRISNLYRKITSFDQIRKNKLDKLHDAFDRSKKGSLDAPIVDLIHYINTLDNFVTTSSCSGRFAIFCAKYIEEKDSQISVYSSKASLWIPFHRKVENGCSLNIVPLHTKRLIMCMTTSWKNAGVLCCSNSSHLFFMYLIRNNRYRMN